MDLMVVFVIFLALIKQANYNDQSYLNQIIF